MTEVRQNKITSYHALLFAICFLSVAFGGIVSSLMSSYLPAVTKELAIDQTNNSNAGAYINAAFVFGWAIGGFTWGIIGDKIGRKKAVLFSVAWYGVFTVFTGYVNNWTAIALCRFASGFGMGGVLVATTTIMIEEWNEKSKPVIMGFLSIAMPIGIFSAGWIVSLSNNWRQGFLIGIVPIMIAVISIWLLQESKKWKSSRSKISSTEKITTSTFSIEHRKNLITGSAIFGSMLVGLWAIFSWLPTWLSSIINNEDANTKIGTVMMVFGAGGITGGVISGWILNSIGSRKSMLLSFLACSICSFLLFKTNNSFSNFVYAEIAGIALFFGVSQGVLSVYIPELFPVHIRATATGFCFNIGRLLTATAVLFVGLLQTFLGGCGNALFIFSFVFVIGLIATIFSSKEPESIFEEINKPKQEVINANV
jgi:MFS family permease